MLKQPVLIRDRVIMDLLRLRAWMSGLPEMEVDAMHLLEDVDALTATADFLLTRLGHAAPHCKTPRFGKTHRALTKKTGPRGQPKAAI